MATKKTAGTTRSYKRKQPLSLRNLKVGKYFNNAEKPISVLVGLLAGSPIAIWIDKQMTAKKVFGMEGDKLKKWVKPGTNFILGMTAHFLAKDPRIKLAGVGLAANGGLIALKELLGGKDLLKGLVDEIGNTNDVGATTARVLDNVAIQSGSTPLNLPLLPIDEDVDESTSEIIENVINEDDNAPSTEEENIEGNLESGGPEIGKTEEQIAGEDEPVIDDDYDLDEIP
jgi:hypothetical protein